MSMSSPLPNTSKVSLHAKGIASRLCCTQPKRKRKTPVTNMGHIMSGYVAPPARSLCVCYAAGCDQPRHGGSHLSARPCIAAAGDGAVQKCYTHKKGGKERTRMVVSKYQAQLFQTTATYCWTCCCAGVHMHHHAQCAIRAHPMHTRIMSKWHPAPANRWPPRRGKAEGQHIRHPCACLV